MFNIRGTYTITLDAEKLSLTNEDLLNLKILETPIHKGQFIGGRILCAVPGDRSPQIKALQHIIEIDCEDYLGKKSTAVYKPDARPPKSLLTHYKEKRELIAEEPNSVKQPASVSYTPESPSLGDGS
jgi:hypothetical protein